MLLAIETNEYDAIVKMCGFGPTQCTCAKCQNMCKRGPCLGTPSDILKIIKAGYGDRIWATLWIAGAKYGLPEIEMYQPESLLDHSCVFFKKGRCLLHDPGLKPTEGILADCRATECNDKQYPPAWIVAISWLEEYNKPIIEEIKRLLK